MPVKNTMGKLAILVWILKDLVLCLQNNEITKMSDVTNLPSFPSSYKECDYFNSCRRQYECRCDETCILYDDCCEEADTTNYTQSYSSMKIYMSCMLMEWSRNSFHGHAYYVISRCPKLFPDEQIRQGCHNHEINSVFDRIPVLSNRTKLIYRNRFCAQCHGLKTEEVIMWEIIVHCKSFIDRPMKSMQIQEIVNEFFISDSCGYRYSLASEHYYLNPRYCPPVHNYKYMYVDDCSGRYDPLVRDLCRKFYRPLYIYYQNRLLSFYRNSFCLRCDNTPINASILDNFVLKCIGPHTQIHRYHPMIIMLNFNALLYDSPSIEFQQDTRPLCKEHEVLINRLAKCVTLHCPENSFARYSKCVPYHKEINSYAVNALFHINGSVDELNVKDRLRKFFYDVGMKCGEYIPTSNEHVNNISLMTGSDSLSNQSCMLAIMQQEFRRQSFDLHTDRIQCVQYHLQQHVQQLTDDVIMTYTDDVTSSSCIVNETFRISPFIMTPFLRIPNETITCPSIKIYKLQPEKITDRNSDMNLNTTEEYYGIGGIVVNTQNVTATPNGYFICWSIFKTYYDTSHVEAEMSIYSIITHACLGISVTSLLITLCHYCVVPKLLTNHSIILLHLVVITFLSHSLYVVGLQLTPDTTACWIISIVLHCLFLTLFSSSSLALLQITRQLRSMKNPFVKKNIMSILTRYVFCGYIVSFCVVGATSIVKKVLFSDDVWYGRNVCFISNPYVLFYSFALPVAASLLCNICIFSFTVRFFCLDTFTKDNIVKINRNYFLLSLKLASLLGISWLVGYIAVITRHKVLVVIYEVTTALHGVVLSAGLLSNQAVYNWYKAKCSCRGRLEVSRNSQSTTDTKHTAASKM